MSSRRTEQRSRQRARIVAAAHALFAERGFDEVTVADVAEAAGVARATVFNHFGSKHALVEALTEGVLAFYEAMLANALAEEHAPTPVLVRALFEQMAIGIEEDRNFYRGVFREMARLQLGFDEGGPGHRAALRTQQLLVKLLSRGQERGDLVRSHDPAALASAFTSLVNGTITHWLYESSEGSLRERMVAAAQVFLGPVEAGPPRRPRRLPDLVPPRDRWPWSTEEGST